ncbi:hypothetical protein ACDI13_03550 [Alcaligenes faecalis]|uniref:hypothetical protein n=1 Tax=Alcaligenes faecalis TaxID=511 RepID=UPI0035561489
MDNGPIVFREYRGMRFAVECYRIRSDADAWEWGVVICDQHGESLTPERRDHDHWHPSYEKAKEAGIAMAQQMIDKMVANEA